MAVLITGIVFTVVGVVGFFITGFANFAEHTDQHLLWFEINPLHNLVHLALGLIGLAMWRTTTQALTYGYIVLVGYAGAFVYGLIAMDKEWDILSINTADNVLHLILAAVGLGIVVLGHSALASERGRGRAPSRTTYGASGRNYGANA